MLEGWLKKWAPTKPDLTTYAGSGVTDLDQLLRFRVSQGSDESALSRAK